MKSTIQIIVNFTLQLCQPINLLKTWLKVCVAITKPYLYFCNFTNCPLDKNLKPSNCLAILSLFICLWIKRTCWSRRVALHLDLRYALPPGDRSGRVGLLTLYPRCFRRLSFGVQHSIFFCWQVGVTSTQRGPDGAGHWIGIASRLGRGKNYTYRHEPND